MARCCWSLTALRDNSYVIIGGVVVGASWYIGRLALGPSGEGTSMFRFFTKCSISLHLTLPSRLDEEQPHPLEHH